MRVLKIQSISTSLLIEPTKMVGKIVKVYSHSNPKIKKLDYIGDYVFTEKLYSGTILKSNGFGSDIPFEVDSYSFNQGFTIFLNSFELNEEYADKFYGSEIIQSDFEIKMGEKVKNLSFGGLSVDFLTKVYSITELIQLIGETSFTDNNYAQKLQQKVKEKYEMDCYICGNALSVNGLIHTSNNLLIIGNLNFKADEWRSIGKTENTLYEQKDKDGLCIPNEKDSELIKDLIKDLIIRGHYNLIQSNIQNLIRDWLHQIKNESENIRKNINEQNRLFWEKIRRKIEVWDLRFLDLFLDVPREISKCENINYASFNKTNNNEFIDKRNSQNKSIFRNLNMVKEALKNLATPGRTHDEHILQIETEKVNERMLMLSFLAVSIPLLGAIIAPGIPREIKIYAAIFLITLPISYGLFRKIQKKQNEKKNKKSELKRIYNYILEDIRTGEKQLDELQTEADLGSDLKDSILPILTKYMKNLKTQSETIKKQL